MPALGNKILAEVKESISSLGGFAGWSVFMWLVFWFLLCVSGILLYTSDLFSMANKLLLYWIFQWIGNRTLTMEKTWVCFHWSALLLCFHNLQRNYKTVMGTEFQFASRRTNRSKKYTVLSGLNWNFRNFALIIPTCGFAMVVQPLLNVLGIVQQRQQCLEQGMWLFFYEPKIVWICGKVGKASS